jgi:hypothetical protein
MLDTVATFSQRYCLEFWNASIVKIDILAQCLVLGITIPPMAGLSIVAYAVATLTADRAGRLRC